MKKIFTSSGPPVVVIAIVIAILSIAGAPASLAANETTDQQVASIKAHTAADTMLVVAQANVGSLVVAKNDSTPVVRETEFAVNTATVSAPEVTARICPNFVATISAKNGADTKSAR